MMKIRKKLVYLVASHVKYEQLCLPVILPSMTDVDKRDIIVTVAGASAFKIEVKDDITYYYVTDNSFEYSSFINLVENKITKAEYVFLLHDTMVCGPEFARKSLMFRRNKYIFRAERHGFCNIGAFSVDYLYSIKNSIIALKNCNKYLAVAKEGHFYDTNLAGYYENPIFVPQGQCDFYNNGTQRHKMYYPSVDVTKYGANTITLLKAGTVLACP